MVMRVLDPVGALAKAPEGRPIRTVEALEGRRLGLLWSKHAASVKFWPVLEEVLVERFKPTEIVRLYKQSTWNPAPAEDVEEFARKIDWAVIGVGA